MVVHVHIDILAGRLQPFSDTEVVLAGRQVSRGVVMHEDHSRRVALQDHLDHLPGIDGAGGEGTLEQVYQVDDLMSIKSQS